MESKNNIEEKVCKVPTKESNNKADESKDRSGDSDSNLVISLTPEKIISSLNRPKRRKRKRPISSSEDDYEEDETQIDRALEEKLQECAQRNNLSSVEIKKIIKSLVANDHVLALVKLQEEEEIAREEAGRKKRKISNCTYSFCSYPSKDECIPKLTRAKARALNKKPMPIPPLNEKEPEPEVAALICQELNSDEDDEEYCPKEEDYVSDDDPTTVSDIDSQPRTPMTPSQHHHDITAETPPHFSEDGLFKVPQQPDNVGSSHQEEIIAKRTRSKLCLQTTPIEAIESNFIPPDITTDMYDFDGELDQEWVEFLNEFTKPLSTTSNAEEDGDEADPEYIADDKIPIDAEELRDVNISKKELSDLIAELFDGLVKESPTGEEISSLETPQKRDTSNVNGDRSPEKSSQRKRQKSSTNSVELLPSKSVYSQEQQQPPEQIQQIQFTETPNNETSSVELSVHSETYFNPSIVSTPQHNSNNNKQIFDNETEGSTPVPLQLFPTTVNNESAAPKPPLTNLITTSPSSNQLNYISLAIPLNILSNGQTPRFFAVPVTFPQNTSNSGTSYRIVDTIDLTEIFNDDCDVAKPTTSHPEPNLPQSSITPQKSPNHEKSTRRKKKVPIRIYRDLKDMYAKEYEKLKSIEFTLPNEQQLNKNQIAFTEFQRKILNQQMRIHVQFCVQHFIQTYSHPELWKLAQPEKDMLLKLKEYLNNSELKENSTFNAWNLKPALDLIKYWEDELSICSEENRALMDYFYNEIDRVKNYRKKHIRIMRFPPRIMKLIVQSKVFMYPKLLPKIPFRFNVNNIHHEFFPSEDYIIANAMEYYFEEIKNEEKYDKQKYDCRMSDLRKVCEKIAKNLITWRPWKTIYSYIIFCRDKKITYNPIKFYFERGRAPPFKHVLYPIDLNNVLPPQSRISELPPVWKEFVKKLTENYLQEFFENSRNKTTVSTLSKVPNEIIISNENSQVQKILLNPTNSKEQQHQTKAVFNANDCITQTNDSNGSKNVVINFNYIFDNSLSKNPTELSNILNNTCPTNLFNNSLTKTNYNYFTNLQNQQNENLQQKQYNININDDVICINENFNSILTNDLELSTTITTASRINNQSEKQIQLEITNNDSEIQQNLSTTQSPSLKGQKLLTDYFKCVSHSSSQISSNTEKSILTQKSLNKKLYKNNKFHSVNLLKKKLLRKTIFKRNKFKKFLKHKFEILLNTYRKFINKIYKKYQNKNLQNVYIKFKSLELYTNLLKKLKMNCKKMKFTGAGVTSITTTTTTTTTSIISTNSIVSSGSTGMNSFCSTEESLGGAAGGGKRPRLNDDESSKMKKSTMKANENLKQILMSESNEDINKKDAIYAFNFYEKVEEALKEKKDVESFNKFQNLLKKFDPKTDRVADLYNKIENLLLPNYPDLLEIFLTFLLPSQAVEIGKFFEYFMVTNMNNFVNKLNIYFNKQPSQIKKVYTSLNELSDENDLTMEKIKLKILPLLKGNQFLTDWFLQMFPSEEPPKSLGTIYENINAKQMETQSQTCYTQEFISQKDLVPDSPEHQQPCQIRYINGRIFYGSRILLPAKLAFIAKDLSKDEEWQENTKNSDSDDDEDNSDTRNNEIDNDEDCDDDDDERLTGTGNSSRCVHHIKSYAEKILKRSLGDKDSCTEGEKSEDEEARDFETKYEICDDVMHRKHAVRLNPSLYSSGSSNFTCQTKINIVDREINKSPKKQCVKPPCIVSIPLTTTTTNLTEITSGTSVSSITISKEKRKSPTKKPSPKSPGPGKKPIFNQFTNVSNLPVITETTTTNTANANVIKTDKKIKAIIEEDSNSSVTLLEQKKKIVIIKNSPTSQKSPTTITINTSSDHPSLACDSDSSRQSNISVTSVIELKPSIPLSQTSLLSQTSSSIPSQASTPSTSTTNWTRDEDKIILEEVKQGFDCENSLANRLKMKLSNRTVDEIVQRHQFLMDVLSQLQNRT